MERRRFDPRPFLEQQLRRSRERAVRLANIRQMGAAADGARRFRPRLEYFVIAAALLLLVTMLALVSVPDPNLNAAGTPGPFAEQSAVAIASVTTTGTPGSRTPATAVAAMGTIYPFPIDGLATAGPGFATLVPTDGGTTVALGATTYPFGTLIAGGPQPVGTPPGGDFDYTPTTGTGTSVANIFPTPFGGDFATPPPIDAPDGTGTYPSPGIAVGPTASLPTFPPAGGGSGNPPDGFTPLPATPTTPRAVAPQPTATTPSNTGPYPDPSSGEPPPLPTTPRPQPTARPQPTVAPFTPVPIPPTPRPAATRAPAATTVPARTQPPAQQPTTAGPNDPYPAPTEELPEDPEPTTAGPGSAATPTRGFTPVVPTPGTGQPTPGPGQPTPGTGQATPVVAATTVVPTATPIPPTATPVPPTATPEPTATPTPIPLTVLRGNIHWTVADSPVVLDQDTVLATDANLLIDPGVNVQIEAGVEFVIEGNLNAGGGSEPMRFTGPTGRWAGIFGQPGSSIALRNVELRQGGRGGVTVTTNGGFLLIHDSLLTDNGGGISSTGGAVDIQRTRMYGNNLPQGPAILLNLTQAPVKLIGNVVGANQLPQGTPQVKLVAGTNGSGPLTIEGNLLYGEGAPGLDLTTAAALQGTVRCNGFIGGPVGFALNSSTPSARGFALAFDQNAFSQQATYGASSTVALEGANNWWGDPSGPADATRNAEGRGVRVGVNIGIQPWLTERPACAPAP